VKKQEHYRHNLLRISFTKLPSDTKLSQSVSLRNVSDGVTKFVPRADFERCEISSSHGGEYDVQSCLLSCLLGCTAV
jgi:nitrogen fixation protein